MSVPQIVKWGESLRVRWRIKKIFGVEWRLEDQPG